MACCALCDTPIDAGNDSREHLIPNAIGGRRKVPGVLCVACNSKAGDSWDAALARQLNPLSLLFGIARERGEPPSQDFKTVGGQELRLHADGTAQPSRPTYQERPTEDGVHIHLVARDLPEAKRLLKGVARKYPQVGPSVPLAQARQVTTYIDDHLHVTLSLGGPLAGRSLVKSALCLAVHHGVDAGACDHARAYLRSDDAPACFGYYYARDLVLQRPARTVFHCVAVKGSAASGLLLGYLEFYGVLRVVVCLSDRYAGSEVSACQAINPLTGEELALAVDLSLTKADVEAAFRYECIPPGSIERALESVLPIAMTASYEREKERVLEKATRFAFANCGAAPGDTLTREHLDKLSRLMAEKIAPFLAHVRRR
jgi:hypothetical protein